MPEELDMNNNAGEPDIPDPVPEPDKNVTTPDGTKGADPADTVEFECPDQSCAVELPSLEEALEISAVEDTLGMLEEKVPDEISLSENGDKSSIAGQDVRAPRDEQVVIHAPGKKGKKKKVALFVIGGIALALIAAAFLLYFLVKPAFYLNEGNTVTWEAAVPFSDPGWKAKFLGIGIGGKVSVTGDADVSAPGEFTLKYEMKFHGKDYSLERRVIVVDTTPPVITLVDSGEMTVSAMRLFKEPGFTAEDSVDGDLSDQVKFEQVEDGETGIIVYTVSDKSGNTTAEQRRVTIKDIVEPEISLNGDAEAETTDAKWHDPGVTAIDDLDGDISDSVTVETDYEEATEGTFNFLYVVKDAAGNTSSITRKLTVTDGEPPVISLEGGPAVYLFKGEKFSDPGAKAEDGFEGDVKVKADGTVDTSKVGKYTVTYTASDSKGNTATLERNVYVSESPVQNAGGITGGGVVSNSTIYLTFDDGPSYITPEVLDVLAKYNVKATFFIINYSDANKDIIARAIREGHTIGIHGFSHDYSIIYTSAEAGMQNITTLHDKLVADFGYSTNITRFPGGSSNTISRNYCTGVMSELCPLAEQRGYTYFDWNVSSEDATAGGVPAATIYSSVVNNLRHDRGNVVLMHDSYGKDTTVAALSNIIEYGMSNDYTFAALSSNTPPVHHPINN